MRQHGFSAMGTEWALLAEGGSSSALSDAAQQVRDVEARLSRFLPSSALSRLNREREAHDPVLAAVLRAAMRFWQSTAGAFDPTLGARLAALGYDRTFAEVTRPADAPASARVADLQVAIEGCHVALEGEGEVDLGGIAKGWTVDLVLEQLRATGAERVLVDGGGDIAVHGGEWPIGVGDDLSVTLRGGAIATSSTLRRRWLSESGGCLHHVLSARTGLPAASRVDTVTVVAPDATTADALATALLADPAGQVATLAELGCAAALRVTSGDWYTTSNWSEAP